MPDTEPRHPAQPLTEKQMWTYVQNYADAKSEVVEAIIARARAATVQG